MSLNKNALGLEKEHGQAHFAILYWLKRTKLKSKKASPKKDEPRSK